VLVAPTFNIGMAQHHLAFPGTIFLRPSTFIAGDRRLGALAVAHGFEKIYFLNGHGGNVATIEAAFSEIYAEYSFREERSALRPEAEELVGPEGRAQPGQPAVPDRPRQPRHAVRDRGDPVGLSRQHQDRRTTPAKIAPTGPIREALDFRARYADGRMGSDPALATPEKGGALVAQAAKSLIEDLADFSAEARV
jgi:creatinine amidohydrolase